MATLSAPASREAIAALTAAFRADPVVRWLYPEETEYDAHFPRFAEAFGGNAFTCGTAFFQEGAAALWLPPGAGPDENALVEVLVETVSPTRLDAVFAQLEQMGRAHPAEPHWYLPLIGVEPERRGAGLGGALMREVLARCDHDGLPAYLESTNPRNIPFYERLGFRVAGVIQVADAPAIIPMRRF